MADEMNAMKLVKANLAKLPNKKAKLRVLAYVTEMTEEEAETELKSDPRQVSLLSDAGE